MGGKGNTMENRAIKTTNKKTIKEMSVDWLMPGNTESNSNEKPLFLEHFRIVGPLDSAISFVQLYKVVCSTSENCLR